LKLEVYIIRPFSTVGWSGIVGSNRAELAWSIRSVDGR